MPLPRPIGLSGVVLLLLLSGCATIEENPQRVGAPVTGGAVGVAAGQAIGTTAAEAGLGAVGVVAGVVAAPYLEKRDTVFLDKAIDIAAVAEPGKPVSWANPNTGTTGTLTREGDADGSDGQTCRTLRSEVRTKTEVTVESMVVCRPDLGTWYIQSSWLESNKPLDASPAK